MRKGGKYNGERRNDLYGKMPFGNMDRDQSLVK